MGVSGMKQGWDKVIRGGESKENQDQISTKITYEDKIIIKKYGRRREGERDLKLKS